MSPLEQNLPLIKQAVSAAQDRFALWGEILIRTQSPCCAEIGVYEGAFAEQVLRQCEQIERYYMVDPWRHLDEWNKPLNRSDNEFVAVKEKALGRTRFAADKITVLQGTTTEVADQIPDDSLDYCYIDGDHTLRGITVDLQRCWPKMKHGGLLTGDDFCRSIWQHSGRFEPTLVFPYAVYFAEAVGVPVIALPYEQFAIVVDRSPSRRFEFIDLTGEYGTTTLRDAMSSAHRPTIMRRATRRVSRTLFGSSA